MSCPTCDHTMHRIALPTFGMPVYWCSRCRTINGGPLQAVPKLVERCRNLLRSVEGKDSMRNVDNLGIIEAVMGPGDRAKLRERIGVEPWP